VLCILEERTLGCATIPARHRSTRITDSAALAESHLAGDFNVAAGYIPGDERLQRWKKGKKRREENDKERERETAAVDWQQQRHERDVSISGSKEPRNSREETTKVDARAITVHHIKARE